MLCKHCGNRVDPENPVCPYCGTAISLSGGNGFWDMAEGPSKTGGERVVEKIVEVKKPAIIPIAISAAICLLTLVLMITGRISAGKNIRKLTYDYEDQLSQQKSEYENRINELDSRILTLEEDLNRPRETQNPVRILDHPTSEIQSAGFSSRSGYYLFRCRIEGPATEFIWTKKQSDGTWTILDFTQGVDRRFGLKREESIQDGWSKLIAVNLTQESAGTYRCIVITDHGSASTDVDLTIKPSRSPSSIIAPEPILPSDTDDQEHSGEAETTEDKTNPSSDPWSKFYG